MPLMDSRAQKPRRKSTLPEDFNLPQDEDSDKMMVPIGTRRMSSKLKVGENSSTTILLSDHPAELGFAFTAWKARDLTFG